jgi:hypothetical protein
MVDEKLLLRKAQDDIWNAYVQNMISLMPPDKQPRGQVYSDEYMQTMRILARVEPQSNKAELAEIPTVINAIKKYLLGVGNPLTEPEIIDGLLAGGFRKSAPGRTTGNIKKSIGQHTKGSASGKSVLRRVGDKIGLGEWEDEMFR